MASNQITVGNGGKWQIVVDLVTQSVSNNRSTVRVRGIMHNNSGRSYDATGVSLSISGTNSWTGSREFDLSSNESYAIIDERFNVTHNSDGRKSVSYTVRLGSTVTGTFGSGGSVSVSMTLPRITPPVQAKIPAKSSPPTLELSGRTSFRASWPATANNGASIIEYRVRVDNTASFTSPVITSAGSSRSVNITNAAMGRRWYVCVQARNSVGWGPWSDHRSILIPTPPDRVGTPRLRYSPPSTVEMSWATPDNGGSGIRSYDYQYADNSSFSNATTVNTLSISNTIRNLQPGKTYWFRARAKNDQGTGAWSNAASVVVVSGPYIRFEDEWRKSICYVRFEDEWRMAIPYVRYNGTWDIAGSG